MIGSGCCNYSPDSKCLGLLRVLCFPHLFAKIGLREHLPETPFLCLWFPSFQLQFSHEFSLQDTGALLFGTRFSEAFPSAPKHAATPHRVVARTLRSGSPRPRLSVAFFLAREKVRAEGPPLCPLDPRITQDHPRVFSGSLEFNRLAVENVKILSDISQG